LFGLNADSGHSAFGPEADLNSLQIAETFRRTVRSSGAKKSSRPANQSIVSRTSSPWLTDMP
jgi:hypothetical protein